METIDKENLPQHTVIVPDGNRRWARKRGLAPWRGHVAGAKKAEEQIQAALDLGLTCLTWWGGSWDNLTKRSKIETKNLFWIYEKYFRKLIKAKEVYEHQVKINVFGRWREILPKSGVKAAEELIEATENHKNKLLNFMIAYDGQDEMLAAIKGIVQEARKNKTLKITSELLKKHLWSGELPLVDLLIRTGSSQDPHNSVGFMMWLTSDSQLIFPKGYYPDFSRKELIEAVREYQRRERRLGR
ncbi:MAG: polyprenyl diphosphate synthase [Patescibacteria group bacterium]